MASVGKGCGKQALSSHPEHPRAAGKLELRLCILFEMWFGKPAQIKAAFVEHPFVEWPENFQPCKTSPRSSHWLLTLLAFLTEPRQPPSQHQRLCVGCLSSEGRGGLTTSFHEQSFTQPEIPATTEPHTPPAQPPATDQSSSHGPGVTMCRGSLLEAAAGDRALVPLWVCGLSRCG